MSLSGHTNIIEARFL